MADFCTAESVTRYLRAKTSAPETVVPTARKLLAGDFPLYLPNSAMFVFDLVCDRVGDFSGKSFLPWKYCPQLWQLWWEVWQALGSDALDREMRAKAFRRVKTVSVATAVVDHVCGEVAKHHVVTPESAALLQSMFLCLDTFSTSGYIDVDEYSAVGLLKSYSQLLLAMGSAPRHNLPIDRWTSLVNGVYELPHQAVTYKPSRKSMAKYFADVLPVHLVLFADHMLPSDTHNTLHSIFSSILFKLERNSLPAHIAAAMQTAPDFLHERAVSFLFSEVLSNLASTNIAACESIYIKLTTGKFAHMADHLINVLASVNKTLSPTFFSEIYAKELSQSPTNWVLLSRLLQLDPALTISKWKEVVAGGSKEPLANILVIAENIASGFVRARDFPLFATDVYPYALKVSRHWASAAVVAKLTPKVKELSGNQIARLTKQFLDSHALKPLSLLVQGLLFCPLAKQKAPQSLFTDYSFCHAGWSEVAYYVLCVYGEPVLKSHPNIMDKVFDNNNHNPKSDTDLALVFRIAELSGDPLLIDAKLVLAYIKSMPKDTLVAFAERWVVILGLVPNAYSEWLSRVFASLDPQPVLHFFNTRNALLCELPAFLTALSDFLKHSSPSCIYELISTFPPMVFRKFFGEFLPKMCTEALAQPKNAIIRSTLRHVLQDPGLTSPVEKDFQILHQLVAGSNEETLADTLAVANGIWRAHIASIKIPQSKAYVENAIKTLEKNLKALTPTAKKQSKADAKTSQNADLLLSRVILSTESAKQLDSFEAFLEKYVAVICGDMTKENIEQQLSALSELPNLTDPAKAHIKKAVRDFGAEQVSAECQAQLFSLVTKVSDKGDAQFIIALFVALSQCHSKLPARDSTREALLASIRSYISALPDDTYTDIFALCLKSLRDAPAEYVSPLTDACSVLLSYVRVENELAHAKLLVVFMSAFIERNTDLQSPATVLLFVKTLTQLLVDKTWVFKQYTVELVLGIVHLLVHEKDFGAASQDVYLAVVRLVSCVVLFHRHRLSSRYHLVVKVFTDMMMPISNVGVLRGSSACAAAYARVLTSLCEPQSHASTKESDALTSRTALFRKALRKHAHILLVNYIYIRLNHQFSAEVNDQMMSGIYSLFSLFSKNELSLANQCLDPSGRAYYQSLYSTYKDHGRWKE
ncbi:hypothetical protein JCM33374_g1873 [Metschnikowia sp. JCM 33374]|nr:hypothetical protein JCM33374_g1873 [Metschnikowia sp. JCM 33374]